MARPKGSKNKQSPGLSFNKRMKVLQAIILDTNQKTCDRLSAIKNMTDMLSDKVKESKSENPITTIKLEQTIAEKPKEIPPAIITQPNNVAPSVVTEVVDNKPVIEDNTLEFNFNIIKEV